MRTPFLVRVISSSILFVDGVPEIVKGPSEEEIRIERETTLVIHDNLISPRGRRRSPLTVGIISVGNGERGDKATEFERVAYMPCPTNDDINRIRSLLRTGTQKRCFDDLRVTWGNWIRKCMLCFDNISPEASLKETLRKVNEQFAKWEDFSHTKLADCIFQPETVAHRLLRVVPKRCAPWRGPQSLVSWEAFWASKELEEKVSGIVFEKIRQRSSV
jgi:hypothetical protein